MRNGAVFVYTSEVYLGGGELVANGWLKFIVKI